MDPLRGNDSMDEPLKGLYSPKLKQVACVLIHAAFGEADRRVNNIFDAKDWFVAPVDDMIMITAPRWQWEVIAEMAPEDRPGPEKFQRTPL